MNAQTQHGRDFQQLSGPETSKWPLSWERIVSSVLPALGSSGVRPDVQSEFQEVFSWLSARHSGAKDEFEEIARNLGMLESMSTPQAREMAEAAEPDSPSNIQLLGRLAFAAFLYRSDPLFLREFSGSQDKNHKGLEGKLRRFVLPEESSRMLLLKAVMNKEVLPAAETALLSGILHEYISLQVPRGLWKRVEAVFAVSKRRVPDNFRMIFGSDLEREEYDFLKEIAIAGALHLQAERSAKEAETAQQEAERAKAQAEERKSLEAKTEYLKTESEVAVKQRELVEAKDALLKTAIRYLELRDGQLPPELNLPKVEKILADMNPKSIMAEGSSDMSVYGHIVRFRSLGLPNWDPDKLCTRDAVLGLKAEKDYDAARKQWARRLEEVYQRGITIIVPRELGFQIQRLPYEHPLRRRCTEESLSGFKIEIAPGEMNFDDRGWDGFHVRFQKKEDPRFASTSYISFSGIRNSISEIQSSTPGSSAIESFTFGVLLHAIENYDGKPCPRVP